jgi:hypothetical protein
MSIFIFKIQAGQHVYTYQGTLESLSLHLKKNAHLEPKVIDSETKFS